MADTQAPAEPVIIYTSFEDDKDQCATALLALSTAVGWTHYDLPKWQSLMANSSEVFVAEREDGSYVGCCLRTSYAVTDAKQPGYAMLGMMLVDPTMQGRGIGKKLLANFQKRVEALGEICGMGSATASGRPVYEKAGYKPVTPTASVCGIGAPSSIAVQLKCEDAIKVEVSSGHASGSMYGKACKDLLTLDREISGLERAKQLTNLTMAEGSVVAVASQGENIIGTLLSTVDSLTGALNLGPIHGSEAASTALIVAIAREFPDGQLAMSIHDHHEYCEALKGSGFIIKAVNTGTMILGDATMPGDRSKYVGLISPALG